MDSGLAAVIGAITGAAASVIVVLIDRVVSSFQGRAERKRGERLELRAALLEVNRSLVALGARVGGDHDDLALHADIAMATLDLLVSHDEHPLIAAATQTAQLALAGSSHGPRATAAFRELSGEWYRGRITADVLYQRFHDQVASKD